LSCHLHSHAQLARTSEVYILHLQYVNEGCKLRLVPTFDGYILRNGLVESRQECHMANSNQSRTARQRTRQLDDALSSIQLPQRPSSGWISALRKSLGMGTTQLAKRMGITRPSLNQLEANEVSDKITLASLRNAAHALGCDLQYALVPRQSLSKMVADQAEYRALRKLGRINQSQALEASAMATESLNKAVMDLAKEIEINRPADLWND
jgi:predicted DNA-binding mobile mystery protein A